MYKTLLLLALAVVFCQSNSRSTPCDNRNNDSLYCSNNSENNIKIADIELVDKSSKIKNPTIKIKPNTKLHNIKKYNQQENKQEDTDDGKHENNQPMQSTSSQPKQEDKQVAKPTNSTKSNKPTTSKNSTRSVNNLLEKYQGIYNGTGVLIFDQEEIEEIANISIIITKSSNNIAEVSVIDEDGNDLFDSSLKYKAEKSNSTGGIVMHCELDETMTISIDSAFNLIYKNPTIEVEDITYTFRINATKE